MSSPFWSDAVTSFPGDPGQEPYGNLRARMWKKESVSVSGALPAALLRDQVSNNDSIAESLPSGVVELPLSVV
jgi:hypothetical protein